MWSDNQSRKGFRLDLIPNISIWLDNPSITDNKLDEEIVPEIVEEAEAAIKEDVEQASETMTEQVDSYISYIVNVHKYILVERFIFIKLYN